MLPPLMEDVLILMFEYGWKIEKTSSIKYSKFKSQITEEKFCANT